MESSVDRDPDEHAKPKSSSLSPKVARPKLPTFPPSFRSLKSRPKTDPGHGGEISRAVLEDIMKLKEVNYAKYSRLRPSRSQPSKVPQTTTSTPTSPVTGSSSPDNSKSAFSRRQSRSLKLTELTDRLKSGRLSNDTSCNIPSLSDLSTVATYGTLRKMRNIQDFSQCDESLDSPDNSPEDARVSQASEDLPQAASSAVDEEEEAEELSSHEELKDSSSDMCLVKEESSTHSFDCLPSPDNEKSFTDDGQSTSESDTSSTTSGPYIYQPLTRDSEFFKLAKTAPQRRTGITTLATRGRVQAMFGTSYPSRVAGFQQTDDQDEIASGGQRRYPRRTESVIVSSSGQRKTDRFITHPPHRKTTFKEEGSIDSNGFGSVKTEELQEETTSDQSGDSIPVLAAGSIPTLDNQTCPDEFRDYSNLQEQNLVTEVSESERFEKKNGKSTKQKSISDPSSDKTKSASDIAKEINSSHAHSSPILSRELESGGPLPEFQESDNSAQKPHSELILHQASPKFSNPERRISQESQRCQSPGIDSTIEEGDETDQSAVYLSDSLLKPDKPVYAGSSAPTTPQSQSPTSTLERAPHNLLSVPIPRKPIHRSMSSASVLQRDRRLLWGGDKDKDKDVVRKYSINSDDSIPGNINSGSSVPEFANSLGDNGGYLTTSMPDVWKQNTSLFDSPERAQAYEKICETENGIEIFQSVEGFALLENEDQRYHIVQELYQNEQEYVDALKTLKEKYMIPLKTQRNLDENIVCVIFHMIPEILTHHCIFLNFLDSVWENWDSKNSTVGNIIISCFFKQTVLDSYISFVENYEKSGSVIENDLLTKSSVSKFIEQCQKDSGSKLSMKDLIVRPIQRIPRYELLIQRLAENTPKDHPDYLLLMQAEKVMHDMALKIGSISNSEEGQHETLKKLELLLITDLAAPDRTYLRHDMVQIMSKKDQCCIWMFSDLIIISSTKRKSGPVTRKVSIILQSPSGQDFAENMKHKICLRVGLDDIEVLKDPSSLSRRSTIEKEQIEDDLNLLNQISEITTKLNCSKQNLEEVIRDLGMNLNKQLTEHQNRIHSADANKLELQITTQEKVFNLIVVFVSAEKRLAWETSFLDAKHKLSLLSDKRAPEFLQPLQITKTRAGMQFSCAAPIDGVNANGYREVWVCNSDGYVGHMCLLSLQPEPIVTLNTPVPGCNARILCICAVPAFSGSRRRSSVKNRRNRTAETGVAGSTGTSCSERPRINIESVDTCMESIGEDAGSPSDSESSDDDAYTMPHQMESEELCVEVEDAPSSPTEGNQDNSDPNATTRWMHDTMKSTMWLGTEDGCIHIFLCTDNIKTTKNKLKIQHGAPVYCIIYLDNKVFVSLANGDLIVYRRDLDGQWDTEHPYTRTLGSATCPISKMHAVAGKLWCGSQNNICIVNPLTLKIEHQFVVNPDVSRCVQCIVSSGQGVWVAPQQSSKVNLYHATTYEFLHEINITPAVTQKLQSADDIIRQHKTACLRVTALLICKDLLWVGTSAGVILTIPVPKITSTTTRSTINCPTVTGLVYGHTGHVRFLTSVELPNNTTQKSDPNNISITAAIGGSSGTTTTGTSSTNTNNNGNNNNNNNNGSNTQQQQQFQSQSAVSGSEGSNNGSSVPQEASGSPPPEGNLSLQEIQRRSSMATTATMATRMLVISGGDGYEDFRNNVANEAAGRDDSTNHLLLWQV